MTISRSVPSILIALLLVGCGRASSRSGENETLTSGPGPTLALVDSVVLAESDTLYIGKPEVGLTVDDSGMIYVADEFWNRVVRFRRDGTVNRVFGHAGDGPGEFRSLTAATLVYDSLLLQPTSAKIKVFNRFDGRFLLERRVQPSVMDQSILAGDRLLIASYDFGTKRGLKSIPFGDFLDETRGPSTEGYASTLVKPPPEFATYPGLVNTAGTSVSAWGDTVMVGFMGVDYLVRYTPTGDPLDTIVIPTRLRRGAGPKGREVFAKGVKYDFVAVVASHSLMLRHWRLPDGSFLVWHEDNSATKRKGNFLLSGVAFISVLSKDGKEACVDARLPFPGSDWPRITMRGDTLYALDQTSSGVDSTRAQTVVRRYLVETDKCAWLKTASTPP